MTSLSLALLLLAIFEILDYYSSEEWAISNVPGLRLIVIGLFAPIVHVIYRLEHRRQNNFIGRNIHDYIFLIFLFILGRLYNYISGYTMDYKFEEWYQIIVNLATFIIMVMIFESLISFVKYLLRLRKWQIL